MIRRSLIFLASSILLVFQASARDVEILPGKGVKIKISTNKYTVSKSEPIEKVSLSKDLSLKQIGTCFRNKKIRDAIEIDPIDVLPPAEKFLDNLIKGKFRKLKILNLKLQELSTVEHAKKLVSLIINTPSLLELHLEFNNFNDDALEIFFPYLFKYKVRIYLENNHISQFGMSNLYKLQAKCQKPFGVCKGPQIPENSYRTFPETKRKLFAELDENTLYFGSPNLKADCEGNLFIPDSFLDREFSYPGSSHNYTIPVIKIGDSLHLYEKLPLNIQIEPGAIPHFFASKYVPLENLLLEENRDTPVRDMQIEQLGYVTNWEVY